VGTHVYTASPKLETWERDTKNMGTRMGTHYKENYMKEDLNRKHNTLKTQQFDKQNYVKQNLNRKHNSLFLNMLIVKLNYLP